MCSLPGCEDDKIYVWVFWRLEPNTPHSLWAHLCRTHYLEIKDKARDNAYFILEEEK